MNAVKKFNGLNGTVATREELVQLIELAKQQEQPEVVERLEPILSKFDNESFEIDLNRQAVECVPASILPLLCEAPELPDETDGLGKAVSPDDIYQYITDVMINTIKKVGNLPWQREWEKTGLSAGDEATNYESKKGYRGINFFLLNFEIKRDKEGEPYLTWKKWDNPFFLTFKQIEKFKGKLTKGSTGHRVVYFTKLYTHSQEVDGKKLEFGTYNQKKFRAWIVKHQNELVILRSKDWDIDRLANKYIPILKYYNVFNAGDITGIKWEQIPKNENANKPVHEKIEIAEAIVKNYPNPPKIVLAGDQPMYQPLTDTVVQTPIDQFKTPQSYYSTIFHELTHSTGHSKRLNRKELYAYSVPRNRAFEELIAEMGAVFLSAESGILFETRDNSAKYLKGWNSRLLKNMEEDNRFFFRAASASQAAADHILDRDKEGNPAYLKSLKVATAEKPTADASKKDKKPKKPTKKTDTSIKPGWYHRVFIIKKDDTPTEDFEFITTQKAAEKIYNKFIKDLNSEIVTWEKRKYNQLGKVVEVKEIKIQAFPEGRDPRIITPQKTKAELEATNPKGFAKKPKSVAVATAIKHVLGMPKYKGKINERQAAILYKHFKDSAFGSEIFSDVTSDYERGIMQKENLMYDFAISNDQLEITEFGMEFVQAVNGRRESLLNQKNNLSLFDGLNGVTPLEITKEIIKLKLRRNRTKKGSKKHTDLQNKIDALEAKLIRDKDGNTVGVKGKSPVRKAVKRKVKKSPAPVRKKPKGLKSPAPTKTIEPTEPIEPTVSTEPTVSIALKPEPATTAQDIDRGDQVEVPAAPVKNTKVRNMATKPTTGEAQFYTVAGEVGKFFQAVERKPKESVVITLDGEQGAGKTTTLYQIMDAFGKGGNRGIFFSLEEHHESSLAQDKVDKYLSPQSKGLIDITSEIDNKEEFYSLVAIYDIIFIDSWQKLQRMIGAIRLDEDLRKKFDGKVFVIIFQQTTEGRTKGGAEVVFDGDIITKMVKEATFDQNYAYFDKNRYTKVPLENLRYNIAGAYVYNPNETTDVSDVDFTKDYSQEPVEVDGFCITEV